MKIAIVGHEGAKFTEEAKARALVVISSLLEPADTILVSGHCHLGGIDIWAEEIADALKRPKLIFPPKRLQWSGGFRERNIQIATACDVIHNIVVDRLPVSYKGMRFTSCYHCDTKDHVKSGGCWTALYAQRHGKPATWHTIHV